MQFDEICYLLADQFLPFAKIYCGYLSGHERCLEDGVRIATRGVLFYRVRF
ncbi:hypothetical protein [Desulfosediminicola ganghwensis]|uniref:hypothetical protein n=1 Tax=Desulfosediminicola ganghwensis TaxID=2569540 RepID=UPI0012946486|nr:hypothetical protein [Desulfosediminicola ganghwensis]